MFQFNFKSILYSVLFLVLLSCDSSKDPSIKNNVNQEPIVLDLPPIEAQPPRFPEQEPMSLMPKKLTVQILEENSGFDEPMSFVFLMKAGIFSTSRYSLDKIFLGEEDNKPFLFIETDDDVELEAPWKKIYFDPATYYLYGEGGSAKVVIGYVHLLADNSYAIEFLNNYKVIAEERKILISEPKEFIVPKIKSCPSSVQALGEMPCSGYVKIFNSLVSIDFKALGEVAPEVAKDVISAQTAYKLMSSAFDFEPDIDSIREEFLIPLLSSLAQVNELKTLSKNSASYLSKTQEAYSNIIITSLDSAIKIQKMAPEAFSSMGEVALGSALAYIGASTAGDKVISKNQPPWFREVIAPIIREVGVLSIDLVLNGSLTPFEERLNRFSKMEAVA